MRRLSVILIMTGVIFAGLSTDYESVTRAESDYRLLGEITDEPATGWTYWWVGAGNVVDFGIVNTVADCRFGRAWDQQGLYDIMSSSNPDTSAIGNGGEYPRGSGNYYVYACGLWFGAISMEEPNVIKGAYRGDLGAMAVPEMTDHPLGDIHSVGLYLTNMIVPYGQGYDEYEEGKPWFKVPGRTPLPFQTDWPFNDPAFGRSEGEWVSHEDSYAVGGDWIPEEAATGVWVPYKPDDWPGDSIRDYGIQPLGVRVERRTYSWSRSKLRNVIVINFKIRNMNDHVLEAPYFSYFMDNDLGHGGSGPGDDGAWDDLVGYDAENEVVYTYDANGSESGWTGTPGYVGCIFLETPGGVGATGCESWENDTSFHMENEHDGDEIKYEYMGHTGANTWDEPSDVRMMLNSGPYPDMAPDQEYDFTVAVVMGDDLDDLLENIDTVRAQFSQKFPWIAIEEDEIRKEPLRLSLLSTAVTRQEVTVRYSMPSPGKVDLAVFDALGRRMAVLKQGTAPAGEAEATWAASDASSGVYFIRLAAAGEVRTRRVLICK